MAPVPSSPSPFAASVLTYPTAASILPLDSADSVLALDQMTSAALRRVCSKLIPALPDASWMTLSVRPDPMHPREAVPLLPAELRRMTETIRPRQPGR